MINDYGNDPEITLRLRIILMKELNILSLLKGSLK